MRIVIVSPTIGEGFGQEQVINDSSVLLRRAGHQVFFIAEKEHGRLPPIDGGTFVDNLYSLHSLSSPGQMHEVYQKLNEALEALSPDLVHLIDQLDHRLVPLVARYPFVFTAHTVAATSPSSCRLIQNDRICEKVSGWKCLLYHKQYQCLSYLKNDLHRVHAIHTYLRKRKAHRAAKLVLTPSRYIRDLMIHDGWDPEQVQVVYNPVRVNQISPVPVPPNLLVVASRLVPMKGIHYLIRALKLIENLSWSLWICGDGPMKTELHQLSQKVGLGERIRFLGTMPAHQTQEIVASSFAFIQPNLGPESFGLAAAQASALGVAVVAFRVPALAEIIEHEKTGLLAKPASPQSLAQCISRLLKNPLFAGTLGANGPRLMAERFGEDKYLQATLAAYEKVLRPTVTRAA